MILLDDDLGAASGFAGKTASFDLLETNCAVLGGMDGIVAAHVSPGTSLFSFADLSDDNTTSFHLLAAK